MTANITTVATTPYINPIEEALLAGLGAGSYRLVRGDQSGYLLHLQWKEGEKGGRVAVRIDRHDDHLELRQLAGAAPTPAVLGEVINELGLWDLAHSLNETRANSHAVEVHEGMSGSRNYLLRVDKDPHWGDCPVVARLHISMMGKLNEGVKMWLGDFVPLAIASGIGNGSPNGVYLRVVPMYRPTFGWKRGTEDPLKKRPPERGVDYTPPVKLF